MSRTEYTQSNSFQAITDLIILRIAFKTSFVATLAGSTWVQKQQQAPRPTQCEFSEASANKQPGPGPGQEQVWVSSSSPGTRTWPASTLRAGFQRAVTHTHWAATCLPSPLPSPPPPLSNQTHSTNQPQGTRQGVAVGCGLAIRAFF